MNAEELDKYLKEYNLRELFLREYYFSKQNPVTYKKFLDNLDPEYIKKNNIIISELEPNSESTKLLGEEAFLNNKEFNIHVVKHDRYTPAFIHKHEFIEVLYVYSGQCIQTIMGDKISLHEGDICIIAPNSEHSVEVFDDSILINILIRKNTFDSFFLEILNDENILSSFFFKILYTKNYNNYIIFRTNNSTTIRMSIYHLLIESIENRKYNYKMLEYILLILFANLLRHEDNTVELPNELQKNNKHLSDILIYIQNNYKTVTLDELSNKFNYEISHLSKLIKLHTGHNFKDIIQTLKINNAIKLLTYSNHKIYEISELVGYENTTHFIRTFKKIYGISPNKYRQKLDDKNINPTSDS